LANIFHFAAVVLRRTLLFNEENYEEQFVDGVELSL